MVARDRRYAGARHHTEGTARGLRADREVLDARATDRAVRRSAPGDASQCASRSSPSRSRARSTPCRRSTAPRSASAHDAVEEVAHVLARKRGAMIAREGASASIHSARRWRRSSRWAAARVVARSGARRARERAGGSAWRAARRRRARAPGAGARGAGGRPRAKRGRCRARRPRLRDARRGTRR